MTIRVRKMIKPLRPVSGLSKLFHTAMAHASRTIVPVLFLLSSSFAMAQPQFSDYFEDKTLRFDFILAGNHRQINVYPQHMSIETIWPGMAVLPTDEPDLGTYRFRVFDESSGKLIFRRGFATLFQEWQTTAEAKVIDRAYYQGIFMPFPREKAKLLIEHRNWSGQFEPVYETVIDPADYFIRKENPATPDLTYIMHNGDPADKVDLVFLSEGYATGEKEKFIADATGMTEYLFSVAPFSSNAQRFNVSALWTPSAESGTDIPGKNIYRNTRFNSTFYTFDLDRYLTTSDMKSIYDALSGTAWDNFFVLVNSELYGGGGFYNFLGISTTGHYLSKKVMVHEYGHSFAGLADEYYTSTVAYEDFYNLEVEPWEPNITTMVDFPSKWKHMISPGTPVPTPRSAEYERHTGVFEGGGYMSTGIYSPMMDCRMKSNAAEEFCPVCQSAIQRMIELLSR
jgi:hypothetical protein